MATLQLNLIKRWFDLTLQEVKKEEYRDITPYWANRLLCMENGDNITRCFSKDTIDEICFHIKNWQAINYKSSDEVLKLFYIKFKDFELTDFRNGYKSLDKCPRFIIENKGITIGKGNPEWGYVGDDNVFIIQHGKIIVSFNIK